MKGDFADIGKPGITGEKLAPLSLFGGIHGGEGSPEKFAGEGKGNLQGNVDSRAVGRGNRRSC